MADYAALSSEFLTISNQDHIATITLCRPEKLNALNEQMRTGLGQIFAALAQDTDIRVVVLASQGRAFCVGADLGGGGLRTSAEAQASYEATSHRQLDSWNLPQPVIAAVNGYCLGRGMELALWCDFVIAGTTAKFGEPEVRDGSFVASILPWLVGPQQAKLLMLTGDTIDANQAHQAGIVTAIADSEDSLPTALELARRLVHVPPATARAVKRYVNAAVDGSTLVAGQHYGNALGASLRSLTPAELGTEHLEQIKETQGLKAYLTARDAPFGPP